jgi:hypothetical protein
MIDDSAYYRNILNTLNKIVNESDDDIPNPPSRVELQRNKILRFIQSHVKNYNFWHDFIWTTPTIGQYRLPLHSIGPILIVWFSVNNNEILVDEAMEIDVGYPVNPRDRQDIENGNLIAINKLRRRMTLRLETQLPKLVHEKYGAQSQFQLGEWLDDTNMEVYSKDFANWVKNELNGIQPFCTEENFDTFIVELERKLIGSQYDR